MCTFSLDWIDPFFFSFSFSFFDAGCFCSENIGSTLTKPKYCVLLIEELRASDRIEPRSQDWQASLSHRNDSDCLISYCCFPKIWLRLKRTHLENVLWTECRVWPSRSWFDSGHESPSFRLTLTYHFRISNW